MTWNDPTDDEDLGVRQRPLVLLHRGVLRQRGGDREDLLRLKALPAARLMRVRRKPVGKKNADGVNTSRATTAKQVPGNGGERSPAARG